MGQKISLLLFALFFFAPASAQDFPDAPSGHKFWDRTNRALFAIHAGLESVDMGITHYNLSGGGRELNPMGKRLCESGTPGQFVFFAGRTVGVAGISYALHKLKRHRMERAFMVVASVDSAYGVTYSFAHR